MDMLQTPRKEEAMDSALAWRTLFENWPESIDKTGTIVLRQGETIPFANFLLSAGLVLLERSSPDVSGSRKVVVCYDAIAVVKLNSPAPLPKFQAMGFQQPL